MKPILTIENISKCFLINHKGLPYLNFRDKITGLFKHKNVEEEFWALKDVSFSVQPGASLGIIGRNGAGKSTLLKILSKITPPTKGKIITRGRVASLLEVGTGFHPELTGRENIFMNGSILGMKSREIRACFDQIVDFSGVERFLDTPLKQYSSGMQLRLAFAVAAHLEPEILIIDEVLAVGDGEFQKKCMKKMKDVSGQGRTILFVSHNLGAINSLCNEALLLNEGMILKEGAVAGVIEEYNKLSSAHGNNILKQKEIRSDDGNLCIQGIKITDLVNRQCDTFSVDAGDAWKLTLTIKVKENIKHFIAALGIVTDLDYPVRTLFSIPQDVAPGKYIIDFVNDDVFLGASNYKLIIGLSSREQNLLSISDGLALEVREVHDKAKFIRSTAKTGFIINTSNVIITSE